MQGVSFKMITVTFNDKKTKQYPKHVSCLEVAKDRQHLFKDDIIIAKLDQTVVELNTKLNKDCSLEFFDLRHRIGNEVYLRGLIYILIKAVKDVLGFNTEIKIEHSIDKGIYCELLTTTNNNIAFKIEQRMQEIASANIPFERNIVTKKEAVEYFKAIKRLDKVKSLSFLTETNIVLYKLDNLYDYFFGHMPLSTGYIRRFALTFVEPNGLVLLFPTIYDSDNIPTYNHRLKVFEEFRQYRNWGKIIGVNNAADLNEKIIKGQAVELIKISEVVQNSKLYEIASEINRRRDKIKIVLMAGPSSSGKTITSHKLSLYLKSKGLNPKIIGLDDYYVDRADTPKDEEGNYDFETIKSIDNVLLNDHLTRLLQREEVSIPTYNFITGKKEYKNRLLKLDENDILIIEGLHALNEDLGINIPRDNKFKLYISPLTVLNIDHHNRISTSFVRKLRRIVRDNRNRGYSANETLDSWRKVRAGEEKYIFPFQEETDMIFNTAFIYELSVLKTYAEPLLYSVPEDSIHYDEARQLIRFLKNFLPIPSEEIPKDSLLREFIGGGYE
jgi:uridine kinase